ncbi:MAG: hypothetical protein KDA63_13830 [Planctomycetales bacterium]|nr:hypothetical protein [Planctomycetales bacterium]
MKAEIVDESRRNEWDRFVLEHPGTISWHVYDWHRVLEKYYGLRYFPIAACDGASIRGVLPLYYVRTFKSGPALMSIPYFVAGGIVADGDESRQLLLDRAIVLSKEMGGLPITLKQYGVKLAGDLTTDGSYYNRELSLSAGLDDVWKNLDEVNRQYIDDTRSEPLQLEYPSNDFRGFYRTLRRFQHALGTPCASKAWVRLLIESGSYEIALLRRGSEIVAATLAKRFRDSVSFPFTCLPSQEDGAIRYAFRLYWELITRLEGEQVRIVHSGRIPDDGNVPAYRLGWGGPQQRYYYQYYGLQGKTESSSKRGWVRRSGGTVWKMLPATVSNLLDPLVIRQYP